MYEKLSKFLQGSDEQVEVLTGKFDKIVSQQYKKLKQIVKVGYQISDPDVNIVMSSTCGM